MPTTIKHREFRGPIRVIDDRGNEALVSAGDLLAWTRARADFLQPKLAAVGAATPELDAAGTVTRQNLRELPWPQLRDRVLDAVRNASKAPPGQGGIPAAMAMELVERIELLRGGQD